MPTRKASAIWNGTLQQGNGNMKTPTGTVDQPFSFSSRFENGQGSNPEELLASAHAGCFSMALSLAISEAGYEPKSIETEDTIHLEKDDSGFSITKIETHTKANIPGIDNDTFQKHAQETQQNCPVSKALKSVNLELNAELSS